MYSENPVKSGVKQRSNYKELIGLILGKRFYGRKKDN